MELRAGLSICIHGGKEEEKGEELEELRGYSTDSLGTWEQGALGGSENFWSRVFSLCHSLVHGEMLDDQSPKVQQCNAASP